jgi:hypothetical protein
MGQLEEPSELRLHCFVRKNWVRSAKGQKAIDAIISCIYVTLLLFGLLFRTKTLRAYAEVVGF